MITGELIEEDKIISELAAGNFRVEKDGDRYKIVFTRLHIYLNLNIYKHLSPDTIKWRFGIVGRTYESTMKVDNGQKSLSEQLAAKMRVWAKNRLEKNNSNGLSAEEKILKRLRDEISELVSLYEMAALAKALEWVAGEREKLEKMAGIRGGSTPKTDGGDIRVEDNKVIEIDVSGDKSLYDLYYELKDE